MRTNETTINTEIRVNFLRKMILNNDKLVIGLVILIWALLIILSYMSVTYAGLHWTMIFCGMVILFAALVVAIITKGSGIRRKHDTSI